MRRWYAGLLISIMLLLAIFVLASCGSSGVGTVPRGTPSLGNGTLAVIPSTGVTGQVIPSASAGVLHATYAFVRNNQLWVALHGAKPVQATSFNYANLPNVSWHQPLWSPGDGALAFIMNARPAGQGGGGCPAPDYGANGALYVLNVGSMQLTQVIVPADKSDALAGSSHNGYWQYVFWEDATHVLAWYNGIIGKTSNTAGLYRYDLSSHTLSLVISPGQLGVSTLFSMRQNAPIVLSMRYSSGQLYYQVVAHPFEQQSQLTIYRHSVDQPGIASSKVLDMGSEAWCGSQLGNAFSGPGWDVSPDGQQLAAQVMQTSSGPYTYSATLANPAALQPYAPGATGLVAWKTDSSAFVLQSSNMATVTDAAQIFLFNTGDAQGQLLMSGARDFMWG